MIAQYLPPFVLDNMWFVFLTASFLTWPMAWIADSAFKEAAFGLIGNYVVLMVGSLVGATWIMVHMGSANRVMANPEISFFAAVAGASACILTACMFKKLITR